MRVRMKGLRAMLATALVAVAFCGHAQQRLERDRAPMGGGRGFFGAPSFPRGGQGDRPGFQGPPTGRYGPPSLPRGGQGDRPGLQGPPTGRYGPPSYPPQHYGPPPGYPPQHYGPPASYPPYGGPDRAPAMGGEWRNQENFLRQGVREGQLAPLGRVIENIRRVTPGRQLDAGLEYIGPRLVYRVRWMTAQGRRVDYYVDAATGAMLPGR